MTAWDPDAWTRNMMEDLRTNGGTPSCQGRRHRCGFHKDCLDFTEAICHGRP